ncbi:hypothetical protein CBER1_01172 [Cercospora berteroae]|uniref:Transcription factor domain-containing protein n=1 Tax=Cercospora berteroae TaxID=357750 RepID=A0A2S6CIP8_9PEZI|nr:hypothetical protein CBER1_01172 [Cercospora berteroae]
MDTYSVPDQARQLLYDGILNNRRQTGLPAEIDKCAAVMTFEGSPHHRPVEDQAPCWWSSAEATASLQRPLAGLKIVDLTRVIAGPSISRGLAELGASVIRVTAPHLPDFTGLHPDLNWGKWNCCLDLRQAEDREKLRKLIQEADVVVDGYRPGVFDKYGFGMENVLAQSRERKSGVIYARENSHGWKGEWQHRSGWQPISDAVGRFSVSPTAAACLRPRLSHLHASDNVCTLETRSREYISANPPMPAQNTGISFGFGRAMGHDEPVTPVFPNSDYCLANVQLSTGVAGCVGVLQALIQRAERGGSLVVDIALNYYNAWLASECGRYPAAVWDDVWKRHGSRAFRHFQSMNVPVPAYLGMIQANAADTLFRPAFFERRRSGALGLDMQVVRPGIRFPKDTIELRYNVEPAADVLAFDHLPESTTREAAEHEEELTPQHTSDPQPPQIPDSLSQGPSPARGDDMDLHWSQPLETSAPEPNEDDVMARICQRIASGKVKPPTRSSRRIWRSMEYQNSFNATGILGEALARHESCRLMDIAPKEPAVERSQRDLELLGLDEHDISFLSAKGAFELPPDQACQEMFKVYFHYAFPYPPVVDRGELLAAYDWREHSSFLLQALLANTVPYASKELVEKCGYATHAAAPKSFYQRATLLYDFNCEKSQLALLRGSLLLGTQWVSYFSDKDFTFWVRLDNARLVRSKQCDTPTLTIDDWPDDETSCPHHLDRLLPPVETYHKQFLIQMAALARIGSADHSALLALQRHSLDDKQVSDLQDAIFEWRLALPRELRVESVKSWKQEGIWVLVLMAWCYRMECMFYRALRKPRRPIAPEWATMTERLHASIFELYTVVRRAITHQVCSLVPMSFSTAVATNVAFCIEMLLSPGLTTSDKLMCEEAIRTGTACLVEQQESRPCLTWMLRLFDWAFTHSGLCFTSGAVDFGLQNRSANSTSPNGGRPTQDSWSIMLGPDSMSSLFQMDSGVLSGADWPEWLTS